MSLASFVRDPRNRKLVRVMRTASGIGLLVAASGLIAARFFGENISALNMGLCTAFATFGLTILLSELLHFLKERRNHA